MAEATGTDPMPDEIQCSICGTTAASRESRGDSASVDCPRCGQFSVSGSTLAVLPSLIGHDRRKATLLGYVLRRMPRTPSPPLLTADLVQRVLASERLPTPQVQAENLVQWLGEHSEQGSIVVVSSEIHGAIVGMVDLHGLHLILDGLKGSNLIKWYATMGDEQSVELTFNGWKFFDQLCARAASNHRLAAVMSTDVVGFTSLMAKDEKRTLAALDACTSMLREAVRRHRGRLVKTTGDGTLSEFGSAVEAMRAALEIQIATQQQNASKPEDKRVVLRVGLSVGDVSPDGADILGDSVNLAARLQAEAAPGTICTTEHVLEDLANKLSVTSQSLGIRDMKGIGRRVAVVQIIPE